MANTPIPDKVTLKAIIDDMNGPCDTGPTCDFCCRPAVYDGKTRLGPWAYMCEECRITYGVHSECFVHRLKKDSR